MKKTLRIVAVPLLISVAITLLRLAGELGHWSAAWFSPVTGGILPSGWSWVVGITWLPALFGPYFAYRLWGAGDRPPNLILTLGLALLGVAMVFFGMRAFQPRIQGQEQGREREGEEAAVHVVLREVADRAGSRILQRPSAGQGGVGGTERLSRAVVWVRLVILRAPSASPEGSTAIVVLRRPQKRSASG